MSESHSRPCECRYDYHLGECISLQTVIYQELLVPLTLYRMLYPWQQHLLPVASEIMCELDCWSEAEPQHKILTMNSDTITISWL